MIKTYFLTIILFLVTCCGLAQSREQRQILQLLDTQVSAWNKGDIGAFMKTYWNNDSLMFVGKKGVVYGYQNTLRRYQQTYFNREQMGQLAFDILQVKKLSGDYYSVLGRFMLKRTVGDVDGYFTLLTRKINGRWVIVSDHSS